jgi:benzoate membrane transport protein
VIQAATAAGLSQAQLDSWVFAIMVGGGAASLVLALGYRQPISGAYSIAGAALLVTTLPRFPLAEAVGAYLVSGLLILALALTGLFGRAIERIPPEIVMGMLAGVLFRFGVGIFTPLAREPVLVLLMVLTFLLLQRRGWRTATLFALLVGMAVAGASGQFRLERVALQLTTPQLQAPTFLLEAVLSLSLPLTLLALTSQNAPGIGILLAQGYRPPSNAITLVSGLGSLLTAPLGGHGVNIAAPMTAICSSPAAHPDLSGRYAATVINGLLFVAFGFVGATATTIMLALPPAVIAVTAGLGMVGPLMQALRKSLGQDRHAFGAFFAVVIAASDVTLLNVGAPFWSLLGGLVVSRLLDR